MKRYTLREKLFKRMIIFLIGGVLFIGSVFSYFVYKSEFNKTKAILQQRNHTITYYISSYFSTFYNTVNLLSNIDEIIYAPKLGEKAKKNALKTLLMLQKSNHNLKYIYVGYKNKTFLINDYSPPKGFNPTIRPWYLTAVKSAPNPSDGVLYQDIKTKEWLFSVSRALMDKNGTIQGVIAIDVPILKIKKLIDERFGNYKNSQNFIIKDCGDIITFKDSPYKHNSYLSKIRDIIIQSKKDEGELDLNINNKSLLVYFHFIKGLNWYIVTTVDKNEILYPIIEKILILSLLFIIYALFMEKIAGRIIEKEVIIPIETLEKRVEDIINNKELSDNIEYPPNEIGEIAANIEKITSTELYKKNIELEKAYKKFEKLSLYDPLTQLFNRRKILEDLHKERERALRYKNPFSIIYLDIDFFKNINDTYGHDIGDAVLSTLAKIIKDRIREIDVASRWGGEEFLILCPETDLDGALKLAEDLRESVEKYNFPSNLHITISLGVAEFKDKEEIDDLIKRADRNLYLAKKIGRNRVVAENKED